ncbi:MAG: biotin--[acetyl-CoA-carboxylase] ligase, partial [Moraxella sp.]|nr:biotin--[acetyl-CoA-carboxylase] ligase [Moraxella sp.]
GRGQHGRTWQSPLGNVYLSLYVPTQAYAWQQNLCLSYRLDGRLSLCVGYQLSQIPIIEHINQTRLAKHLPSIGVKWVNDVGFYQPQDNLPDQFQKLSGILIEPVNVAGHMLGVVVGVGVNIAHAPALTQQTQEGLNYQAVSLQDLTKQRLQPRDFYQPISDAIANAIGQFNQLQAAEASQQFIHDFAQKDVLKNKHLQIHNALSEQSITGIAAGIDAQGCLLIEQADGSTQTIWTGTIQVVDSAVSSLQANKHK